MVVSSAPPAAHRQGQPDGWDMHSPRAASTAEADGRARREDTGLLPPRTDSSGGPPVTVTIQQRVGRAHVEAFLEWTKGITSANEQFDGFISTTVLREPFDDGTGELFITIIKYSNFSSARRWNQSPERKAWLAKLEAIGIESPATSPATMDFSGFPVFTGLVSLGATSPPRWRIWLLIWIQVYSLVELYEVILPLLFGARLWADLNLHLKFLVGTFCTTVTIEYLTHKPICWLSTKVLGFLPDLGVKSGKSV